MDNRTHPFTTLLIGMIFGLLFAMLVKSSENHIALLPTEGNELTWSIQVIENEPILILTTDSGEYRYDAEGVKWHYDRSEDQIEYAVTIEGSTDSRDLEIHLHSSKALPAR